MYSRLDKIAAGMTAKASAAVQKAALDVEGQAKGIAPVDTGFHKSAIQSQSMGALEAHVNAGAEYAVYLEYGTSKMAAQPAMVPAAEAVRSSFIRAMGQIV
jgi:HK97 gp10 family phage protein